jgi:hypothetical protein
MTIRPVQRRAAVAALALAVAVVAGLVACAAPGTPGGSGGGTTTTLVPSTTSTTSTTVAGGGGAPTTSVGGPTTTTAGGGTVGGPTTSAGPGGSTTTTAAVPTTTTAVPTTTTWPTADVTVAPSVASVSTNPGFGFVKVYWNNQKPNQLIYVDICARPSASPGFSTGLDCAPLSELNVNGSPSGKGVADLLVFRGAEPSGDLSWGCFAPGDVAPAGILKLTTCYVRVTNGSLSNSADAKDAAFTLG